MRSRGIGRAAAGDAVPGTIWRGSPPRIALPRRRPGKTHWPGRRRRADCAARSRLRAPVAPEQITHLLSETLTTELSQQVRRHGLTPEHPDPGGVGDAVGAAERRDDVVFGVTVAASTEIDGIEQMVGLFINTLPLRTGRRQAAHRSAAGGAREPVAADGAPACGAGGDPGRGGGGELFDTLAVFENYPAERASRRRRPAGCG